MSETVLILMLLLAAGVIAAGLLRRLPVPYTVLLVVVGLVLRALADSQPMLAPLADFQLTPDLVLFVFLPTLIFESGFTLNARALLQDMVPVLILAIPALLFSTLVVGLGVAALLPVGLGVALMFGALISATDPVAVVALFKELGTPQRLTVLVEGESLFNDATAIVLFNILLAVALGETFGPAQIGLSVLDFLLVFFGGALIGVLLGAIFSVAIAVLSTGTSMTLVLSVVMAYSGFVVAEHLLHVSGVMAVAAGALTLGALAVPRMARDTGLALTETWEFLALVCNTLLFIMIGMAVDPAHLVGRLDVILATVALLLLARLVVIYLMVPATTRLFDLPRVTLGERHIMWWGGLKGGLAIAIVLSIPAELAARQLLLDVTLGVVMFTLLLNAPSIRPLIRVLGIDRLTAGERFQYVQGVARARARAHATLRRFHAAGVLSRTGLDTAGKRLDAELNVVDGGAGDPQRRFEQYRTGALRAELQTLEDLYKAHLIPYYVFVDLRSELAHAGDSLAQAPTQGGLQGGLFGRIEHGLIRRLRESDRAAGLLARYQRLRLAQHLQRDVARILMTRAALDWVTGQTDIEAQSRARLQRGYRERLAGFSAAVAQVRTEFPDFYARFETGMALRTALANALRDVEEQGHQGVLAAKPLAALDRVLHASIVLAESELPPLPHLHPHELLALVPLLAELDAATLATLATHATSVRFLAGDTVIGEGEHGDALYIIVRGRVRVSQQQGGAGEQMLGELGDGDFFGELALLGEQKRTATVTALGPTMLLRLTRSAVLQLAAHEPSIAERLEQARSERASVAPVQ